MALPDDVRAVIRIFVLGVVPERATMTMTTTFLLVHGSWHGPWCYRYLIDALVERGQRAEAIALPSVGEEPAKLGDLAADGDAVTRAAAAIEGRLIVVGHSYGGAAITQGEYGAHVARLVYLAAFMPDTGRTYPSYLPPGPLPPYVQMRDDGTFVVPSGQARAHFYHDCSDERAAWAEAQLRPQSQAVLATPIRSAAWRRVPSTYVVTTDDRALPPDFQRQFLAQATETRELPGSHSPMLARPGELADLLVACSSG